MVYYPIVVYVQYIDRSLGFKLMNNCYNCAYRDSIPGDTHSRCRFDWGKSDIHPPSVNQHGIAQGWYYFPINYDPVWQTSECEAHSKKRDLEKTSPWNPIEDIMNLMKPK